MRQKWISKAALSVAIAGMLGAAAHAATESVTAEVEFATPITITAISSLQFGLLDAAMSALETVTIATDGTVTDSASNVLNNGQAAATMTVEATANEAIQIFVDNAPGGAGYSLGSFQCDYGGVSIGGCDVGSPLGATSAASATLTIGATLTGNGSSTVGTDNSTFDVTVAYQ